METHRDLAANANDNDAVTPSSAPPTGVGGGGRPSQMTSSHIWAEREGALKAPLRFRDKSDGISLFTRASRLRRFSSSHVHAPAGVKGPQVRRNPDWASNIGAVSVVTSQVLARRL